MKSKAMPALAAAAMIWTQPASADEVTVAVASNFTATLEYIARAFEEQSEHEITIVSGATGRHYAQIVNGAPYDLFFSADMETPVRLEQEGRIQPGTRMNYANGRLALWSRDELVVDEGGDVLREGNFRSLAIANPRVAPYGQAAEEVMAAMGLSERLQRRLVMGENIAQTFQFVDTGNAELGFVAYSQILATGETGSHWLIPASMHSPLRQDLVLLTDRAAAREFLSFVTQPAARAIMEASGYEAAAD